jgi:hypothetical protein
MRNIIGYQQGNLEEDFFGFERTNAGLVHVPSCVSAIPFKSLDPAEVHLRIFSRYTSLSKRTLCSAHAGERSSALAKMDSAGMPHGVRP